MQNIMDAIITFTECNKEKKEIYEGGGGGGGIATLGFHLRAKLPPMKVMMFSPPIIDNTIIMVPQVRAEDGLLYSMAAPSIVSIAIIVK